MFTSTQFVVKFDLWNEHQSLGDERAAEIWMVGATYRNANRKLAVTRPYYWQ